MMASSSSSSEDAGSQRAGPNRSKKRAISIYEAAAGRVMAFGNAVTLRPTPDPVQNEPVSPDEVLFLREERRREDELRGELRANSSAGANTRREQFTNVYFAASRRLLESPPADSADQPRLPSSDLLKALHSYASDYYGALSAGRSTMDWQSLDETALLAVGVLLEEAIEETLGASGDLALAEEVEEDDGEGEEDVAGDGSSTGDAAAAGVLSTRAAIGTANSPVADADDEEAPLPVSKRRRTQV